MARKKKKGGGEAASADGWLERLYASDPKEFVATRKALIDEARGASDEAGVAALQAARKPTVTAWALNQVIRAHPDDVRTLSDAAWEMRAAQQATLAGAAGAPERLRDAKREERRALFTLADAAEALLEEAGTARSPGIQRRLVETLRAGAYGPPEAHHKVTRGILDRDLQVEPGFGFGEAMALAAGPPERRPKTTPPPPARKTQPPPARSTRTEREDGKRAEREAAKQAARQARELERLQKREDALRARELKRRESLRAAARRKQAAAEKEARRLAQRAGRLERIAEKAEKSAEKSRLAADAAWTAATEAAARADQARRAVAALDDHAMLMS